MNKIIPTQQEILPALPTIEGNVDYQELEGQLKRIDGILKSSRIEVDFIEASLTNISERTGVPLEKMSDKYRIKIQQHSSRALRCNIARTW